MLWLSCWLREPAEGDSRIRRRIRLALATIYGLAAAMSLTTCEEPIQSLDIEGLAGLDESPRDELILLNLGARKQDEEHNTPEAPR